MSSDSSRRLQMTYSHLPMVQQRGRCHPLALPQLTRPTLSYCTRQKPSKPECLLSLQKGYNSGGIFVRSTGTLVRQLHLIRS